jgi:hypothetical protein
MADYLPYAGQVAPGVFLWEQDDVVDLQIYIKTSFLFIPCFKKR